MIIPYPITVSINSREKEVAQDYGCILPNNDKLYINRGVRFDGASIPRWLWSLIGSPYTGKYQIGAFIHDMLYAAELYSRAECDKIFLDIMKYCKCGWLKRNIIYSTVRMFGGIVWAQHTEESIFLAKCYVRKVAYAPKR